MKIVTYLNTTKEMIDKKDFNIFVGLSLGNKYFTDENNIKEFITWALDNSKKDIVVLIPDTMHAINCEIRNGFTPTRALNYAKRKGDQLENIVNKLIESEFIEQRNRISIIKFEAIEKDTEYQRRKAAIYYEFDTNPIFHERVLDIVKKSINPDIIKLTDEEYERLTAYPLDELPFLVAGFTHNGQIYNLFPYPGLSDIDPLIVDIQEGTTFAKLTNKLNIQDKVAILEAYSK